MKLLSKVKRFAPVAVVGVAFAVASSGAFAQASAVTINDTSVVATITGLTQTVEDIGLAIIGLVAVVFGFRLIKGFLGR